jgi:hypothetical protein
LKKIIFEHDACYFFTELWPFAPDSTPFGRERKFSCLVISRGPKSGITNSKNQENARPLRGAILFDLVARKKFKT